MTMPEAASAALLDDRMLVTDVVDTLRHGVDVPFDPAAAAPDPALIAALHALYQRQGIEVSDQVLRDGIAAAADRRFTYVPPTGVRALLARLYVGRRRWGPSAAALLIALIVGLGAYYLGYRPYRASQVRQARIELQEGLPARMDALYEAIFNETKVQTAAAEQAVADLVALRDRLEQSYTLRVVDRDGVKPGFWTFPPNNSEATNYYIVVEAVDTDGKVLSMPVTSEDTQRTETVDHWGLRVPQAVYDAVISDKNDDGVIEHSLVGIKQDGFIDVDYAVPVLGGAVTQW